MSILEYLLVNSRIARELAKDGSLTIEELLSSYCETPEAFGYTIRLLERLPGLESDRLKISNCLFDGTLPYDSLIGLTESDLKNLSEIVDYLDLPGKLTQKIKQVIENGTKWEDSYDINTFLENGDLRGFTHVYECFKKFNALDKLTPKPRSIAAKGGHIDCLDWMYKNRVGGWDDQQCQSAVKYDQYECLKFICENTLKCPNHVHDCEMASIAAARAGNLKCLKYLHSAGYTSNASLTAAIQGHSFHCLMYLHTAGFELNPEHLCMSASVSLECFEYVHKIFETAERTIHVCLAAARSNKLDILEYAHEEGYPWNRDIFVTAACSDSLECVKYMHLHECPTIGLTEWSFVDGRCKEYLKTHGII